jgi:hypothetical protein
MRHFMEAMLHFLDATHHSNQVMLHSSAVMTGKHEVTPGIKIPTGIFSKTRAQWCEKCLIINR